MPAPRPLTQCEPPQLDWSRTDTPAATGFDDIYFSVDGGAEESRAVFLAGCNLPHDWTAYPNYTIGELGFGTGLNFLSCWALWEAHPEGQHLDFISIEKYPFSKTELTKALSHFPELAALSKQLIELWPDRVCGFHRIELTDRLTLTLIHDDILPALDSLNCTMDAWFLDGFSPSKNPEMWSATVMQSLAKLSRTGTKLATFTVAGHVRNALIQAGFSVEKKSGFGRKRHRLEAQFIGKSVIDESVIRKPILGKSVIEKGIPKNPIIIGGGIAGASICRAFIREKITPILIEASETLETAASGNRIALVKPRLDLQDRPESRFFLASYLYALRAYQNTAHVLHTGLTHFPKSETEQTRYENLLTQAPLGPEHLIAHSMRSKTAFSFPSALTIDPKGIISQWTSKAVNIIAKVDAFQTKNGTFTVYNEKGAIIAIGDALIICAGHHISTFNIKCLEDLRFSRGQLSWAENHPSIPKPITYGGYAVPLSEGLLIGATHDRLTGTDPHKPSPKDDVENFEKFETATGQKPNPLNSLQSKNNGKRLNICGNISENIPENTPENTPENMPKTIPDSIPENTSRASVRVTTANTLPRVVQTPHNMWALTGLGSRGFVFAPLLSAHIVSQILGRTSPLSLKQQEKFCFFEA